MIVYWIMETFVSSEVKEEPVIELTQVIDYLNDTLRCWISILLIYILSDIFKRKK